MVRVAKIVTCTRVTIKRPHNLMGVRRFWRIPPPQFGLYVEFDRYDELLEFAWSVRIWRNRLLIGESVEELELPGQRFVESASNFQLEGAEAKSYRVEVLIDGVLAASTVVDFGDSEALP